MTGVNFESQAALYLSLLTVYKTVQSLTVG